MNNQFSHLVTPSRTSGLALTELNHVHRLRRRYERAALLLNNALSYSGYLSSYTSKLTGIKDKRFYAYRAAVLAFVNLHPDIYVS